MNTEDTYVFQHGKYKGLSALEIYARDRQYVHWWYRNCGYAQKRLMEKAFKCSATKPDQFSRKREDKDEKATT